MMQFHRRARRRILRSMAAATALAIAVSAIGTALVIRNKLEIMQYRAERQGSILQYSVNTMLLNLDTLSAMVINGNGQIENFDAICDDLIENSVSDHAIGSLQLAPNGVVTQIYPETGNEAGKIDLFADPDRKTEAEWARDTGNTTLAGPYELLQGGFAAVARKPVYLPDAQGQPQFWGFVIEVMNMKGAMQPAHLETFVRDGYDYCFWRTDPKTGEKAIIAESTDHALRYPLSIDVPMPNVTWHFDVMPRSGWISPLNIACILLLILVSMAGAAFITYHRMLEEQKHTVARKNNLLRKSLNHIANCIAICRVQEERLIPVIANHHFLTFMNLTEDEFEALDLSAFLQQNGWADFESALRNSSPEQPLNHNFEAQVFSPATNKKSWFLLNCRTATDEDGTELLYLTMTDINREKTQKEQLKLTRRELAEQIQSGREWEYRAEHDPLTELLNRKAFERITARLNEQNVPVGFLLIDIDHFKDINDEYGHEVGDKLLQRAAQLLRQHIRESDCAFRFGGDEFVVLLCSTTPEHAEYVVRRILALSEQLSASNDTLPSVSLSAGMYFTAGGVDADAYRRADEALYHTKKSGRAGCTVMDADGKVVLELHADMQVQMQMPRQKLLFETQTGIWRLEMPQDAPARMYCDESMLNLLGADRNISPEDCYTHWFSRIEPDYVSTVLAAVNKIMETGHAEVSYPWRHPTRGPMRIRCGGTCDRAFPNGICLYGYHQDMSDISVVTRENDRKSTLEPLLHEINRRIFHSFQTFLGLIDCTDHTIQIIDDADLAHDYAIGAVYPFEHVLQFTNEQVILPADREKFSQLTALENLCKQLEIHEKYEFLINRYNANGEAGLFIYHFCRYDDRQDSIICLAEEITSREEIDSITNELTQHGFLRQTASILQNQPGDYALLHLDIKGFKAINDQIGYERGNTLLRRISDSIKCSLLKPLLLTRGTADQFYCLVRSENVNYDEIFRLCSQRVCIDDINIIVAMRCGVYPIDDKTNPVRFMCDKARMAENAVEKEDNSLPYCVFTDKMKQEYLLKQEILAALEDTIRSERFFTYFQPIYDAKTRRIISAEALVRWIKPNGQIIPPDVFIPTLEENGQISRIDLILTHSVQRCITERLAAGKPAVPVSVNLSRMDFYNEEAMVQLLESVKNAEIPKEYLRFEITESCYTDVPEQGIRALKQLRAYGAKLLIDDFGKGYSSLSSLTEHEFDLVKLDISFIRQIGNERAEAVITASIDMAHMMNAAVIAEGVETEAQYEFLRSRNCDYIQGYLFSKPLPREDYEALLDAESHT